MAVCRGVREFAGGRRKGFEKKSEKKLTKGRKKARGA
jgi:hypothetical protein